MKSSRFWLFYYEPGKTLPKRMTKWMRQRGYLGKEIDPMTKVVRAVVREEDEGKTE